MQKTIVSKRLVFLCASIVMLTFSCRENDRKAELTTRVSTLDTFNLGCAGSFDINPENGKEKINQTYGKESIKNGHWIVFSVIAPIGNQDNTAKITRKKIEEGYYNANKKVGYWKFYNADGTLKDSIKYENDVPVAN